MICLKFVREDKFTEADRRCLYYFKVDFRYMNLLHKLENSRIIHVTR